jgi:hypothetical protein
MDWDIVLPRLAGSLAPGAVLAIAVGPEAPPPWNAELRALTERYSAIQDWQNADLIGLLEGRGVFERLGTKQFDAEPYRRTVEEYIDGLHATSGLARERMGAENVRAFDEAVRALAAPHAMGGVLELAAGGAVTWGRPLSP